jgi:predicted phosphodiesterase
MTPQGSIDLHRTATRTALIAIAAFALSACGLFKGHAEPQPTGPALRQWVQLTGDGAEARVLPTNGQCPTAQLDGASTPMQVRAAASADFPMVCALPIPAATTHLVINGKPMALLHGEPRRIVALGDTGCRIKGAAVQACNDPVAWPFARVAAAAAAEKPDLVIHLGDYYYREKPCPLAKSVCAGSPSGDNWDTWQAELFSPASALLSAAPVVFVRGNHEDCQRGGQGWGRLLSANLWTGACRDQDEAFAVKLGALSLGVLDSSLADDRSPPQRQIDNMITQFDRLKAEMTGREGVMLSHRPIWAKVPLSGMGPFGTLEIGINRAQQLASSGRIPAETDFVLSGHVHHFAAYGFGPARPAQLVAGTGGDLPFDADRPKLVTSSVTLDGLAASRVGFARYGYLLLERLGPDHWKVEPHDVDGKPILACELKSRVLTCPPAS